MDKDGFIKVAAATIPQHLADCKKNHDEILDENINSKGAN